MSTTTIYRKDYQPPAFTVERVALEFDLYDDHALVHNSMKLKRLHPGPLHLYGDEIELVSVHQDKKALSSESYQLQKGDFIMHHCPDEFSLTIVTRIRPQENTQLSGLYRSNHLFCTQCEAEGFRRITFFPDRPDVLTIYTTRITADKEKYPVLLSNGNLLDAMETNDGRHWAVWHDPFKKPSYLFALVAGDLACVQDEFITASGKKVELYLYVEPGNQDKCTHALESLKKAMRWDEKEYGREYDLDRFMIVAVSDFNMGAMENKGLNIFNSKYILARPETATDQDYADIEGVVAHEYFHNWTGNRITCRDWFQLSLKEGLTVFRDQEFSRDMNSRDVYRIMDVKVLRNIQFPEDAGAMAHPVRPESYQEINNFYTATVYNKGAEVIRMQQTLLGKAGFRRGMDLYFKRHDGQAVTIDDFVAAMQDANEVDLTQFKRWYSQAGTPEVTVESEYDAGQLKLMFKQTCPKTPDDDEKKPFHIPIKIALFDNRGESIAIDNDLLELRETEQTFHFDGLQEKPLVSLLRDFSAPIILHQKQSQQELIQQLSFETDGFAKWDAAQKLALNALTSFYAASRAEWELPQSFIQTFNTILEDDCLDKALRAELLALPGFDDAVAHLSHVDVELLEDARDFYRMQLGMGLFNGLSQMYERLWEREDHAMNAQAFQQRKLRNICLWYMMKANEQDTVSICEHQYKHARTMTDQIASFGLLVNCSKEKLRNQTIDDFYQQWKDNELVLDKWFAIQATCELPGTLKRVRELLIHPAFNFKNPNKVRAVIGAFCASNPRQFHAEDGSGYAFLREMLLKIDPINPQIAARLATPFTRLKRFNETRQNQMYETLELLVKQDLSRDLRELVEKSLQA